MYKYKDDLCSVLNKGFLKNVYHRSEVSAYSSAYNFKFPNFFGTKTILYLY